MRYSKQDLGQNISRRENCTNMDELKPLVLSVFEM